MNPASRYFAHPSPSSGAAPFLLAPQHPRRRPAPSKLRRRRFWSRTFPGQFCRSVAAIVATDLAAFARDLTAFAETDFRRHVRPSHSLRIFHAFSARPAPRSVSSSEPKLRPLRRGPFRSRTTCFNGTKSRPAPTLYTRRTAPPARYVLTLSSHLEFSPILCNVVDLSRKYFNCRIQNHVVAMSVE